MKKTLYINNIKQVKLLSDPLKLQLLQVFAESEKTAKEAATSLGESLTKLYRHVDALLDGGLIEITRETPKRGTVERTFRAVAERFEVDQSLFSGIEDSDNMNAVRDLLRAGENEIMQALAHVADQEDPAMTVMRTRVKGSPEQLERLYKSLLNWFEEVQANQEEIPGDYEEAGMMIAFYPIVKDEQADGD
jgi:DNA-binding transcriptional ArsR family regulator